MGVAKNFFGAEHDDVVACETGDVVPFWPYTYANYDLTAAETTEEWAHQSPNGFGGTRSLKCTTTSNPCQVSFMAVDTGVGEVVRFKMKFQEFSKGNFTFYLFHENIGLQCFWNILEDLKV